MAQDHIPQEMPRDAAGVSIPLTPAKTAVARTNNDSVTTGTAVDVTLNVATALVGISAITAGLYVRFAATAASNNFDRYVQAGTTEYFVRPNGCTVVSVIADGATAKLRLTEI